MKNHISATEVLWRDIAGSSLIEFTVILPVLFLLTLGTVDLGYLFYDYDLASKAAYMGAHRAIVSTPAASDITTINWIATDIGQDCSIASGTGSSGLCSSYKNSTTCTKLTTGSCTNGYTYSDTAFIAIVGAMQRIYGCAAGSATCPLQPKNVSVTYDITGTLGFVGQPNGLPMNITVSIACMNHNFFFIGGLIGLRLTEQGCAANPSGWAVPTYSTTLTSEDMMTN
jgi:Flp pilus assembly protein TadG